MKKLRFLSALLLTTGLMALSPGKALAQDYPVLDVLELGENTDITIGAVDNEDRDSPDGFNLYSFVAPKTGVLTIAASGEGDSYGALFSKDWELLTSNDDYYGNANFKFGSEVIEGEQYYIGLRSYGPDETLEGYTITIQYELSVENFILFQCDDFTFEYLEHVYATLEGSDVKISGYIEFGTNITLHATVDDSDLEFDYWANSNGDVIEGSEPTITVSESDFGVIYFAIYKNSSGKKFIPIYSNQNVTYKGNPYIIVGDDFSSTITIDYEVEEGFKFGCINYEYPVDEENYDSMLIEEVSDDPDNKRLTFILPENCLVLNVDFLSSEEDDPVEDDPFVDIWYNDDYYVSAKDLELGEDGVYTGTLYIESEVFNSFSISEVQSNNCDNSWSFGGIKDGVLTLTLFDVDSQPTVYKLTMVKGKRFDLLYDSESCTLSIAEGSGYVVLDDYEDVMHLFVFDGAECQVTAVSNDPEEYTFIKWTSWDDETEIELTEPTLTLNASSNNYWEVVFSSKSYAKVWLTTYPVDGVYAWLEDEDNPGYKIYNNIGFVNPDDVNSYWTNYITVKKGTKLTLRYEIEEGFDYTFVSWINAATGEVFEGKSPTVEVTDDIDFAGFFKRSVTTNNGWMSYCGGSYNYAVEGGKAYEAKYQEGEGDEPASVVLTSIEGYINSMSGILIYSETGTADIVYTNEGAYELPDNQLLGNCSDVSFKLSESEFAGMPMYGLYNQVPGNIGFQLYTGDILPPHKAVLIPETSAPEIPFEAPLRIVIDNEEVGIIQVTGDQIPFDAIFDLLGRRQNNAAAKGLLIKEGQVVLER